MDSRRECGTAAMALRRLYNDTVYCTGWPETEEEKTASGCNRDTAGSDRI